MRVVIDISEDDFGCIYDRYADGEMPDERSLTETTMYAIANGTALPKGHGELIDRQKLLSETYTMVEEDSLREYDILFSSDVENAPTVIEADREDEDESD